MLNSSNKKMIPIIVAVVAIGIFTIIVNSSIPQEKVNEIDQTSIPQKIEESSKGIDEVSKFDSEFTSNIESKQDQTSMVEKSNVSVETIGSIQNKETTKQESASTNNLGKMESTQRAVIIDQLHDEIPNYEFQANVTKILKDAGYQVDLYTTKDITVEFYKKLPSMNYNFILIRSHGGEGDPDEEYPTRLFTGEKYAKEKYTLEQISNQVGYGFPFYDEELKEFQEKHENPYDYAYFTIGSKLIKEGMEGTFPESTIIVGGCQSARSHDLMEALIRRGADHVLGWDATIGSGDNDWAMLLFLEDILINKLTLYDATAKINNETIHDFEEENMLKLFNAAT